MESEERLQYVSKLNMYEKQITYLKNIEIDLDNLYASDSIVLHLDESFNNNIYNKKTTNLSFRMDNDILKSSITEQIKEYNKKIANIAKKLYFEENEK